MRFDEFSWIWLGYKSSCLVDGNFPPQVQDGVLNIGKCFCRLRFLLTSRRLTYKQNCKWRTNPYFRGGHVNSDNTDTVRHCFIPEINVAATKPEVTLPRVAGTYWRIFGDSFSCFRRRSVLCRPVCDAFFYRKYNGDCETGSSYISRYGRASGEIPTTLSILSIGGPVQWRQNRSCATYQYNGNTNTVVFKAEIFLPKVETGRKYVTNEYMGIAVDDLMNGINLYTFCRPTLPYTGSRYGGHQTGNNHISKTAFQWRQILMSAKSPFIPEVQIRWCEIGSSYISLWHR